MLDIIPNSIDEKSIHKGSLTFLWYKKHLISEISFYQI